MTLDERFSELSSSNGIPIVALTGELGVGRTLLVQHYCNQLGEAGRAVFWLNAASRETLYASYLEIGRTSLDYYWEKYAQIFLDLCGGDIDRGQACLRDMLGVGDVDALLDAMDFKQMDELRVIASIKGIMSWLLYPANEWLLVMDNIGVGVDLAEFLPRKLEGRIILIPQDESVRMPPGIATFRVGLWSEDEACELLSALTEEAQETLKGTVSSFVAKS